MHLQRCTGTVDIGHDCQTVEPWENAARASTIARLAVLHVMAAIASPSAAWIRRGVAAGERREFITQIFLLISALARDVG